MGNMGKKESREEIQIPEIPEDDLTFLLANTRYNKKEVKQIYKKFHKQVQDGGMTKAQFVSIYTQDTLDNRNFAAVAEHVFRASDTDHNRVMDFKELVMCLSVTTRGTLDEKIRWIFDFYDINNDSTVEWKEIEEVLTAVGSLGITSGTPEMITESFCRMDADMDGRLTLDEFVNGCLKDTCLLEAIGLVFPVQNKKDKKDKKNKKLAKPQKVENIKTTDKT